jgi:hypothetical protein
MRSPLGLYDAPDPKPDRGEGPGNGRAAGFLAPAPVPAPAPAPAPAHQAVELAQGAGNSTNGRTWAGAGGRRTRGRAASAAVRTRESGCARCACVRACGCTHLRQRPPPTREGPAAPGHPPGCSRWGRPRPLLPPPLPPLPPWPPRLPPPGAAPPPRVRLVGARGWRDALHPAPAHGAGLRGGGWRSCAPKHEHTRDKCSHHTRAHTRTHAHTRAHTQRRSRQPRSERGWGGVRELPPARGARPPSPPSHIKPHAGRLVNASNGVRRTRPGRLRRGSSAGNPPTNAPLAAFNERDVEKDRRQSAVQLHARNVATNTNTRVQPCSCRGDRTAQNMRTAQAGNTTGLAGGRPYSPSFASPSISPHPPNPCPPTAEPTHVCGRLQRPRTARNAPTTARKSVADSIPALLPEMGTL